MYIVMTIVDDEKVSGCLINIEPNTTNEIGAWNWYHSTDQIGWPGIIEPLWVLFYD